MWEKIRVLWQIPELRRKILLTLGLLAIYRLGFQIPLPMVDPEKVATYNEQASSAGGLGSVLQQVAVFSASQLNQVTIFGLGIMPYISASIIFQLLGSVYPPLEELQKEGEAAARKSTNTPATPPWRSASCRVICSCARLSCPTTSSPPPSSTQRRTRSR